MEQVAPQAWTLLPGNGCVHRSSQHLPTSDALASTARRICSRYVDPCGLTAFVSCHLIALDKCPGVRPVGIGEVCRCIIVKAIAIALNEDIQEAAGPSNSVQAN